jgi:uncharacterized protein (TIGR00730 family)
MRFCVFCGSRSGNEETYAAHARRLGAALARRKLGLVYGGASVGLMGAVADAVLQAGGEVIGVIPHGLADKEIAHPGLTHLHLVESMHERKALMETLANGFIALPGGFGTLEEILEIVTWIQLGLHRKPAGLLNVAGYYDPLLQQTDRGLRDGFIPEVLKTALLSDSDPESLVERMLIHQLPPAPVKWLRRDQT